MQKWGRSYLGRDRGTERGRKEPQLFSLIQIKRAVLVPGDLGVR